ncbi:MAG: pyridoxal phosphate-dependent aminotransferase [Alphaproteobacteria bacterium]|nr:pyridoxal phosphate-dependent aminotransferase [Alphaproteobacteria bacterium]
MATDIDTAGPLDRGPLGARGRAEALEASKIREVGNAGMGLDDVIGLWYGEPDLPTPKFITDAAAKALAEGRTFYTENHGIPELREALADYMSGLYAKPVVADRISVTASGMSAVNLVQQVLTDPGDNVVVVGPIWPNLLGTITLMSGEPRFVSLEYGNEAWTLDLDRLFDAVDGRTRAMMINSPSNPTGWVATPAILAEILNFCRQRGIWLIGDEVYARMVYDGRRAAPSVIDIAEPEDRVIAINSFSKAWCMTGWRLGWVTAPASLAPVLEKCIEFHYSCPAEFSQVAAVTAVRDGEPFIAELMQRYGQCRQITVDRLRSYPGISLAEPEGAFYAFFAVEGMTDSLEWCKDVLRQTHVGLAPGSAFGPASEGFIRLCFASSIERLERAFDRLEPMLRGS